MSHDVPSRSPLALVLTAATLLLAACSSAPKTKSSGPKPLRVMTYNIRHGVGTDMELDLRRVAEVIASAEADVVLLQEVDQGCDRSGSVDQAARLGELCGMEHRFATFREFENGHYGMAALTNLPIEEFAVVHLPPDRLRVAALEMVVQHSGREVVVTGLHLVKTEEERLMQARALLERYEEEKRPIVMAGDLNSERTSDVLRALYTRFDVPEKRGAANTFAANQPIKEIDFVLFSPRGRWKFGEHTVMNEPEASDHLPVLVEATLRR